MDLHEFYPAPVFIELGGEYLELRPFDLKAVVWAESFFSKTDTGGVDKMNLILSNPDEYQAYSHAVLEVCYHLLKDRRNYKSLAKFKKTVNENKPTESKIAEYRIVLSLVFKNAFPPRRESAPSRYESGEHGRKYEQEKERAGTNWAKIYVDFSRLLGGCSLDRFYAFTLRQIEEMLYPLYGKERPREWTPEEDDAFKKDNDSLIAELEAEYGTKNRNISHRD